MTDLEKDIREELVRFGSIPTFSTKDVPKLAKLFVKRCRSVENTRLAIGHFLDQDPPKVPGDYELREWAFHNNIATDSDETLESEAASNRIKQLKATSPRCKDCDNTGLIQKSGRVRDPLKPGRYAENGKPAVPHGVREATWVEPCHCAIGRVKANLAFHRDPS